MRGSSPPQFIPRKPTRCDNCNGPINVGDTYYYDKDLAENYCLTCLEFEDEQ